VVDFFACALTRRRSSLSFLLVTKRGCRLGATASAPDACPGPGVVAVAVSCVVRTIPVPEEMHLIKLIVLSQQIHRKEVSTLVALNSYSCINIFHDESIDTYLGQKLEILRN
jgi:hypothetical protein